RHGAAGYVTAEEIPADPLAGPALGRQDLVVSLVDKVQAPADSQAGPPVPKDAQGPLALEPPGEEALPDIMQEELQQGTGEPLAQAMLLRAKALSSLVSQLSAGSGEALLDSSGGGSLSTRGTNGRLKIQAELALREGVFFDKVVLAATRRMDPSCLGGGAGSQQGPTSHGTMTQYLERFGGYSRDRTIGLAQWQCGLAMDLLARGEARGAADTTMMMVFFEQTSLDGSPDLAWLLTHLPDPPNGLFVDRTATPTTTLRPFSPLADQRLLATTLAYVKELDALTTKRSELQKPKAPTKPAPPTKGDPGGDEVAFGREDQLQPTAAGLFFCSRALLLGTLVDRLRLFIEASTRQPFDFPLSGGRRGAHLLARLDELSEGSGAYVMSHWDVSAHLGPELLLPYREPAVLRGIPENSLCYPDTARESKEEMLKVFSLWDSLGLLSITSALAHPKSLCRVFGAYKTPTADRMIGDRRGPNALEGRLLGVSSDLPQGFLLTGFSVPPGYALCGASTDRSDYYHQIWTTPQRTASNAVGPPLCLSELRATRAHGEFLARAVAGLGSARNSLLGRNRGSVYELCGRDPVVCGAFRAILQGDHGGVEIATAAHEGLLEGCGLLAEDRRFVASRPPPISSCAEALVIDDFFAVSLVDASSLKGLEGEARSQALQASTATQCVLRAKEAYRGAQLAGSDHKDNMGSLTYTVAGAEVCSELGLVEQGAVLVGAPLQRRLALSFVTLKAAALPGTSEELISSMLGAWVSYIQFRRPFACFLDSAFKLGVKKAHPSGSPARPLPRKAACELSLLAACAPLLATNIAVHVYCADASLAKGAFCKARVGRDISEAVWHSGTKGGHTRLAPRQPDDPCPETPAELFDGPRGEALPPEELASAKARPLGMDYDFAEVFSASGAVSEAARELGLRVGPRVSLAASEEFDLLRAHVLDWLLYFIMRGFCQRCGVPCILSCAAASFFFELPAAKAARDSERFRFFPSARALCGAESPCHLGFLTTGVPLTVRSSPRLTGKPFEHALASLVRSALAAGREPETEPRPGLESALADDVLLTSNWEVCSSWRWSAKKHINVFESEAALSFYKRLALEGGDRRCALISDSAVVVGSHRKGRSSARLLRSSLKRVGTTTIAGGLYTSLVFGPTRWNPSDDPTRDAPLRTPSGIAVSSGLSREELRDLSSLRGLSRPRANWVRLALVLYTVAFDHPSRLVSAVRISARLLATLVKAPPFAWLLVFSSSGFVPGRSFPGIPMTVAVLTVACVHFLLAVRCKLPLLLGFVELLVMFGRDLYNSGRPYWHFSAAWDLAFTWLSEDALFMQSFILVRIDQPKTRGRAAKHQSGKLEASDLVSEALGQYSGSSGDPKIWGARILNWSADVVDGCFRWPTFFLDRNPLKLPWEMGVFGEIFGKAPSTLLKRARAISGLQAFLAEREATFPCDEKDLYAFLKYMEAEGFAKSRCTGLLEALAFVRHVIGVDEVDDLLKSRRCRGVGVTETFRASKQAPALTVDQLLHLHDVLESHHDPWTRHFAGCALARVVDSITWNFG
ncbi:unnamed protein product, partial [Symbiodinium sp. KB8]